MIGMAGGFRGSRIQGFEKKIMIKGFSLEPSSP
jgi:hypothetical protein